MPGGVVAVGQAAPVAQRFGMIRPVHPRAPFGGQVEPAQRLVKPARGPIGVGQPVLRAQGIRMIAAVRRERGVQLD